MPEHALDGLHVGAGGHGQTGGGVPELMRGEFPESGRLDRRVEDAAPPVAQHQHAAPWGGEDEVGGGVAGAGCGERVG